MDDRQTLLKQLPAVDRLLNEPALSSLAGRVPRVLLVEAAQEAVESLRRTILAVSGTVPDLSPTAVAADAARLATAKAASSLRPVINATGTLLHTNLGRAPLSTAALDAVSESARSYCNLEFDLSSAERGHRYSHVEELLCRLSGAEAAAVVNNNAGAVLLALAALARRAAEQYPQASAGWAIATLPLGRARTGPAPGAWTRLFPALWRTNRFPETE